MKPLECPFCGSESVACDRHILSYVTCGDCLAEGPRHDTESEAIAAWNTLRGRGVPEMREALQEIAMGMGNLSLEQIGDKGVHGINDGKMRGIYLERFVRVSRAALAKAVT